LVLYLDRAANTYAVGTDFFAQVPLTRAGSVFTATGPVTQFVGQCNGQAVPTTFAMTISIEELTLKGSALAITRLSGRLTYGFTCGTPQSESATFTATPA
jgi:hypothetical protein